jgi:hypothetical protein
LRSEGRNCRITASRARNNDIGSDRENSRIGTRRTADALAGDVLAGREPELSGDFFRAIANHGFWFAILVCDAANINSV